MKLRKKRKLKVKTKKILNSFKYALQGFITSFKTERNMKIHIFIMCLVILAAILLKISLAEWIVCLILFGIILAGELFNTAIETVVDMITPYKNEKAKIAKDISAAGVLILAITSIVVGLLIFIPKVYALF